MPRIADKRLLRNGGTVYWHKALSVMNCMVLCLTGFSSLFATSPRSFFIQVA